MPQRKIESFFTSYPKRSYKKGELLFLPDQEVTEIFYLSKGHVRMYGLSAQGGEVTLHLFSPGSYFPLLPIMSNALNPYFYEAFSIVEVYVAPKEDAVNFLKSDADVLWHLATRAFQGLDKLTLRVESLTHANASDRLLSILFYLSRHFGVAKKKSVVFTKTFTHAQIGAFAGLTRETTTREWKKLKEKKLVSLQEGKIVFPDISRVQAALISSLEK